MRKEHIEIQKSTKRRFSNRFFIKCEAIYGKNYLPNEKSRIYQPDVIIKNKISNEILYIIEVECDPVRKALVGAAVLADYSINQMKVKTKPVLIYIIYTEEGIKQIHNFKERIRVAKEYCKHLKDILIFTEKEFKKYKLI